MVKNACILLITCVFLATVYTHKASNMTVKQIVDNRNELHEALVLFYDSKVASSKRYLETKFDAVSLKLSTDYPQIKQIVVDRRDYGSKSKKDYLYDIFNVFDYPTMTLFMHGVRIPIESIKLPDTVSSRVSTRLSASVLDLDTLKDLDSLDKNLTVIAFHSNTESFNKVMIGLAHRFHKLVFVNLKTPELVLNFANKHNIKLAPWKNTVVFSVKLANNFARQMKFSVQPRIRKLVKLILKAKMITSTVFSRHTIANTKHFGKALILLTLDPELHKTEIEFAIKVAEIRYTKIMACSYRLKMMPANSSFKVSACQSAILKHTSSRSAQTASSTSTL